MIDIFCRDLRRCDNIITTIWLPILSSNGHLYSTYVQYFTYNINIIQLLQLLIIGYNK